MIFWWLSLWYNGIQCHRQQNVAERDENIFQPDDTFRNTITNHLPKYGSEKVPGRARRGRFRQNQPQIGPKTAENRTSLEKALSPPKPERLKFSWNVIGLRITYQKFGTKNRSEGQNERTRKNGENRRKWARLTEHPPMSPYV